MMICRLASVAALILAAAYSPAEERAPEPLDLDEALARQSASDLISGAAAAYDCDIAKRSFRKLGTDETPIYMIEVTMQGPECEEAMQLLARHGSIRDFIFREWQQPTDVKGMDPPERPIGSPLGPDESPDQQ